MQTATHTTPARRAVPARRKPGRGQARPVAEATILRMAAAMAADATGAPHAARDHIAYVRGAIAFAEAQNLVTADRAELLRAACGQLINGAAIEARPIAQAAPQDYAYALLIVAVRNHGGASHERPAEIAGMDAYERRTALARLRKDGVIGEPDMWGFHPITAGEG